MNTLQNNETQTNHHALTEKAVLAIPCDTFTLANGLTVIVHENHQAPMVAVNIWYHVGSKDEPAGQTGFAHLFEHLMFGGSGNLPGSYLEHMTGAGALTVNGTTNRDRTNYYQTVPLEALDFALFAESDRMGHFLEGLEQEVLDRQLNVVLNEKKEREGAPYGGEYDRTAKACFPYGHPYAHTVLGEETDLKNATLEDARTWFRRWYRPSNAILTLAGAIDLVTAKEKVSHFFAHIPAGEPQPRPGTWVNAIQGQRREVLEDRVPHARVSLNWNLPPYGDEDTTNLLLLPNILTQGLLSVMNRELVQEAGIAAFVHAWVDPGQVCSQFTISAQAQNGTSPAELEAAILAILASFIAEGPSVETLQRVQDQYQASVIKSYSTVTNIADLLSFSYGTLGDAQGFSRILQAVSEVNTDSIRRTAERWLNDDFYSLHIVPFTASNARIDTPQRSIPPVLLSSEADMPALLKSTLENGIGVSFAARLQQPETLVSLVIPRGWAWDTFAVPGASQLLSRVLRECGTSDFSADEMKEKTERLGADIDISLSQDNLIITLRALTSKLPESLALFAARIRESRFTEQEFERYRLLQINMLESQLNTQEGIVSFVLSQTLFESDHPYAQPMFGAGSPASLANITYEALTTHQQRLLVPDSARLVVTGSGDFDSIISQLNSLFNGWQSTGQQESLNIPPLSHNRAGVWLIDKPGAAQTTIASGTLLPRVTGREDAAFTMLNEILLNGFASRLNYSLREEHNWTYGVNSILLPTNTANIHGFLTSVQADCSAAALSEIYQQLSAITEENPVTHDELEKFRRGELLRLRGGTEGVGQLLNTLRYLIIRHLSDDYWHQHVKDLASLTPADLQFLAQRLIKPQQMIWVVVGDMSQWEESLSDVLPVNLPRIRLKHSDLSGLQAKGLFPDAELL